MNKNINIQNYEEFLIDFIDGTLNDEEHTAVVMFLENNPDIAEEFSGIADFNIDFFDVEFSGKESLKKSFDINLDNYEHYYIAAAEGDLSSDELIQLEEFIEQNPSLEKEYKIFQNLQLSLVEEIPELELNSIKKIELSNGEFVSELSFEEMCIAFFENDLSEEKRILVESTVKFSSVAKGIFNDYYKLHLIPDTNIIYPEKTALKRAIIIPFWQNRAIYAPAIAASIAFFVIFYIVPQINNNSVQQATANIAKLDSVINISKNHNVTAKNQLNSGLDSSDIYSKTVVAIDKSSKNTISNTRVIKKVNLRREIAITRVISIACCENIGPNHDDISSNMKLKIVKLEPAYNNADSGYFLVVAPKKESLIARILPKRLKKTTSRVEKAFSERKAILESKKAFTSFENIAQVALNGFNKMTESDYSFKRKQGADNSVGDNEKQK